MRRLSLQLYGVCVGALALFFVLGAVVWVHGPGPPRERAFVEGASAVLEERLPGPEAPRGEVEAAS